MGKGTVNKVIIIGYLGADPDKRSMPNGVAVATMRVATNEIRKDRNTGENQTQTEWHRIVTFDKLAEICGQYLHKGSKAYFEGRIQTKQWQDQQGQTRYSTEIIANEMQMLDSRNAESSVSYSSGTSVAFQQPNTMTSQNSQPQISNDNNSFRQSYNPQQHSPVTQQRLSPPSTTGYTPSSAIQQQQTAIPPQDLNDESFYHQTEQYSEHTQSYESLVSQPFSPAPLLANNPSPQKTTVTEDQPQAQKPVFDDKIPF